MLLVDALREDFVALDTEVHLKDTFYKGGKLSLFNQLRQKSPESTLLFPMISAAPTVTSVRVKNLVTGGVNTFFEITEEF